MSDYLHELRRAVEEVMNEPVLLFTEHIEIGAGGVIGLMVLSFIIICLFEAMLGTMTKPHGSEDSTPAS